MRTATDLRQPLWTSLTLVSICLTAALAACGSSNAQTTDDGDRSPKPAGDGNQSEAIQLETDGNTAIERIDVNGDGRPDVFKFYRLVSSAPAPAADGKPADPKAEVSSSRKRVLIRKEMDVNFDKRIDIVQYYEGESGKEVLVREEMDLDFDGRVDSTRHYKDSHVSLVELDLGFDGRTDTWRYYQLTRDDDNKSVNRLIEKRKDQSGDGNVDTWEYYTKGKLTKIGSDTNNDGQPDQYRKVGK